MKINLPDFEAEKAYVRDYIKYIAPKVVDSISFYIQTEPYIVTEEQNLFERLLLEQPYILIQWHMDGEDHEVKVYPEWCGFEISYNTKLAIKKEIRRRARNRKARERYHWKKQCLNH